MTMAARVMFTILICLSFVLPARGSGLLVPSDGRSPALKITDHEVDVSIRDGIALTNLTQVFRNESDQRLEGTYVFPLPEEADLTDFRMSFNGTMVKGEVLPADEAARIYESIVRQTKDPGIIEFIGRRLLRMRVFPIEPNSDTTITLSYQQVCRPMSGMRAYHYPLRTPKTDGRAHGTVRFAVDLHTNEALKNIWSPTHAVEIVRDGEHEATVAYEAHGGSLEEDFLLLYNTDESDLGLSVVSYKPKETEAGHFLLLLTPKQLWKEEDPQPQDVVFVIDTSGSMSGEKIEQAKQALSYCIDQLDAKDRFSVVRFSTGFDVLFDEPVEADAARKKEAKSFVDGFTAQGGTNIFDTLTHVMTMKPSGGENPFVVVFLTDGRGNRQAEEILAGLKGTAEEVRIFPFGVGHDVNTMLLDRLANEHKGRPVYVQPGQNLELVLGDFFSVISRPVLTNLRLELPEVNVTDRFPVTLPDLYHGQQLIVAGKFDAPKTGRVTLRAERGGETIEFVWPEVKFEHVEGADAVPAIWAGRKIAFLIDEIRAHGENQEMIDEVIALSQEYGIQTPYTAYLVNPEAQERLVRRGGPSLGMPMAPAARDAQRERLRAITPGGGGLGGGGGGFGGTGAFDAAGEPMSYEEAEQAVTEEAGAAANAVARVQDTLRNKANVADASLDRNQLLQQRINRRWYHRVDGFLVDAEVDEDVSLFVVPFASDAWFELMRSRRDLRPILATGRNVVVLVSEDAALVVTDAETIEGETIVREFTEAQRKAFGLSRGT